MALRSGGTTRHALARALCARTGWHNAAGRPCISAAARVLPALAAYVGHDLPPPPPCAVPAFAQAPSAPAGAVPADGRFDVALACSLADLGLVSLARVRDADDRRAWEAMVAAHHAVLGGIGFGAATWQLRARDAWIGWSADARADNLGRVICDHRFLVLPQVRVQGLASRALRLASARVATDWQDRYQLRPQAVYTYVASDQTGYSYQCAGWEKLGPTSGRRGRVGQVWGLPLIDDGPGDNWKRDLCTRQRPAIGGHAGAYDGQDVDWAQREYGRTRHTDGRVRRLIVDMGRAWSQTRGEEIPVMFPEMAEQKAAYRLMSNPRISMDYIMEPHDEATVDRCREEAFILAIQDTTTLNDTRLEATEGLAELGGGGRGSVGILAHAGLALTAEGRPLSLFAMNADFRDAPEEDSARWVDGLDRARELAAGLPGHAGGLRVRPQGRLLGAARPPVGAAAGADTGREGEVPVGAHRGPARHRGVGTGHPGRRRPARAQGPRCPP